MSNHPARIPAELPVAVIGAGPVGLAAAAHLVSRDEIPIVLCSTQPIGSPVAHTNTLEGATSCCGGPAPAHVDACCADDAEAKAVGEAGCGCGPRGAEVGAAPAAAGHAGSARRAASAGGRERLPLRLVPSNTLREGEGASRCCS